MKQEVRLFKALESLHTCTCLVLSLNPFEFIFICFILFIALLMLRIEHVNHEYCIYMYNTFYYHHY